MTVNESQYGPKKASINAYLIDKKHFFKVRKLRVNVFLLKRENSANTNLSAATKNLFITESVVKQPPQIIKNMCNKSLRNVSLSESQ